MPSIAITQPYEAVYILDPSLGDEQVQPILAKYRGVIETNGGVVESAEVWERRRLAYEIKGRTEGIYVVMLFSSKPAVEAELRRIFQISEDQIRYMIVRRDDAEAVETAPVAAAPAATTETLAATETPAVTETPAEAPAAEAIPEVAPATEEVAGTTAEAAPEAAAPAPETPESETPAEPVAA